VEIKVSDDGQGIDGKFLPYVFDRFRQADASTTRRHGGLGLGLAIVKQLVELHGGTVQAESAGAGQGATFRVSLPRAVSGSYSGAALEKYKTLNFERDQTIPQLDGLKILVVDDHEDARMLARRVLEDRGATVVTAASGSDALKLIDGGGFDLLICDIGMPGMDGFELIRHVRALPPDRGGALKAVALTAFARSEDRHRVLREGYQMHLAKPVEPVELIIVCASLVPAGI
jgi:CheY-like chemotaxis protein